MEEEACIWGTVSKVPSYSLSIYVLLLCALSYCSLLGKKACFVVLRCCFLCVYLKAQQSSVYVFSSLCRNVAMEVECRKASIDWYFLVFDRSRSGAQFSCWNVLNAAWFYHCYVQVTFDAAKLLWKYCKRWNKACFIGNKSRIVLFRLKWVNIWKIPLLAIRPCLREAAWCCLERGEAQI